jgi:glycosyltransferase involved in cell wall biosynthesis
MRLLQLTAGTGSFHCGTCLRDASLVKALRELGHDAQLAPLYLPLVLEEGVDPTPVHLGGINAFLAEKLPFRLPRFLADRLDGQGLLLRAAKKGEMTRARQLGEMTVSMLRGDDGRQAHEIAKLLEWVRGENRPDAVLLSNALLLGLAAPLGRALGVPVLCTLQGEAPFVDALPEPFRARAWELARAKARDVACFIAVSEYTAGLMRTRLALARERVVVVPNGIDPAPYAALARRNKPVIGYLARLCRDKGLETLVEAFRILKQRPEHRELRLVAGGTTLAYDRPALAALAARLDAAGLAGSYSFRSNLTRDEKLALLAEASVFSVPATYGESFGLYLLEAWAAGLPVVQPEHGAFPELLHATGGGLLVPPDDPGALAAGLDALLRDPARAEELGRRGRAAVLERFTLMRMARAVAAVATMPRAAAPAAV